MRGLIFLGWLVMLGAGVQAASLDEIKQQVGDGHWREARAEIAESLTATNLPFAAREDLLFQKDRMERMRQDFSLTREDVFKQIHKLAPTITEEQFASWEKDGSVEFLEVDGTRWYFRSAARNLFRLNHAARVLLTEAGSKAIFSSPNYHLEDLQAIIANYDQTGEKINTPKKWRVTYQISVKPGVVPPGETVPRLAALPAHIKPPVGTSG